MKLIIKILLALIGSSSLVTNSSYAKSMVFNDVKDLQSISRQILSDHTIVGSTLVIFDIDDTLLESISFVGSVKWYQWQAGKDVFDNQGQPIIIKDENRFACIHSTLGTLFELGTSKLTQENTAKIIDDLKVYDLMLLTSRTVDYRGGTERELLINGINLQDKHLLAPNIGLEFTFNDQNRSAKVTYQNGIVMSSGLHKGRVLKALLDKIGKTYQTIYFIDDSLKNVNNMKNEWQADTTKVNIFHYTKVDKSISQVEINQSNQSKQYFDAFLRTAFPERNKVFLNGQCR